MKRLGRTGRILFLFVLFHVTLPYSTADGCYFSERAVALSADQRAIIIKNGDHISITFSTGYTGEKEDFCWLIPLPLPPEPEDVVETGNKGDIAFRILEELTSPMVEYEYESGCFPAGTWVLTPAGTVPIERVTPGAGVYSYERETESWTVSKVTRCLSYRYGGEVITLQVGSETIRATGNHPFLVLEGDRLASRPEPRDVPADDRMAEGPGRWVEARSVRTGDFLLSKNSGKVRVTGIKRSVETTGVYNLEIEGSHTYAVGPAGLLVHNKAQTESAGGGDVGLVTVYGTVILESYEVSVLGAVDASGLLGWLTGHGYRVDPAADREISSPWRGSTDFLFRIRKRKSCILPVWTEG